MGELLYNCNNNTVGLILLQETTLKTKSELISWSNVEIKAVNKTNQPPQQTTKKGNSPNMKMPTTGLGAVKYCRRSQVKTCTTTQKEIKIAYMAQ